MKDVEDIDNDQCEILYIAGDMPDIPPPPCDHDLQLSGLCQTMCVCGHPCNDHYLMGDSCVGGVIDGTSCDCDNVRDVSKMA
jgi:hypothetical protein